MEHHRRRLHTGRRRLFLLPGAHRRHDHFGRLQHRRSRSRRRAARARGGVRMRRGWRARRRPRAGREGVCRAQGGLRKIGRAREELAGPRERRNRAVQVPAVGRVRRRPAAHRDRKAAEIQIEGARMMQILQPPDWAEPRGFSNGIAVKGGTTVYIAGQVGWTGSGVWQAKDFAGQFRQAMRNILDVLAQAGGRAEHIVRLTWYVIDRDEYLAALKPVGEAYREIMGGHYPAMSVVQVSGLVESLARLEIEATAVIPD